jgi:hypothetical protein
VKNANGQQKHSKLFLGPVNYDERKRLVAARNNVKMLPACDADGVSEAVRRLRPNEF